MLSNRAMAPLCVSSRGGSTGEASDWSAEPGAEAVDAQSDVPGRLPPEHRQRAHIRL